jgi:ubiquinone/menaquinone biosynthesis C-methylase UbiE
MSESTIAEAFSRKALVYDEFGRGHLNLARMRSKVRHHLLACLQAGDRVLELNAGTGGDAVYLARRGFHVHATDISPGMLARIEEKIHQENLHEYISVQSCSLLELEDIDRGPFDLIFSNMGGINCVDDPGRVAHGLKNLLVPRGIVVWVIMPPVCLWELFQALRGNFKIAARRLNTRGVLANVEGVRFHTYYYAPGRVIKSFGNDFQPVELRGLSVFTPTADNKDFSSKRPRFYRILSKIDDRFSDFPPFNRMGDFYILTLRYMPDHWK